MLKSLRLEKGVVGRGVKAIIWGEKKNDLSSGCQQRKRLCLGQRERAWLEPVQAPLCGCWGGRRRQRKGLGRGRGRGGLGLGCPHGLQNKKERANTDAALAMDPACGEHCYHPQPTEEDTEGHSVIASKW